MSNDPQLVRDDTEGQSSADAIHAILRFLRTAYHRKMYVISSLVVAGLLGALYYFTATRIYQADAQLLILQSGPDVWSPTMSGEASRQALIPTYERLFTSATVLEGAITELLKGPAEARVDFASLPREKWSNVLQGNVTARAIRRTNVIEVSYRSKSPRAAEAVVRAIVSSYLRFMEDNHKNVSAEIAKILDQERIDIEKKIADKQEDLFAVQKHVKDLDISNKQHVVHPVVQRVLRLNESLVEIQKERLQLEASLAAIRGAVRDGTDLSQHLNAIEPLIGRELMLSGLGLNIQDSETRAQIQRQLMEDRAKLKGLLDHYGEAHPKVVEIATAIQGGEAYLRDYQEMVNQRLAGLEDDRLGPMLLTMVQEKLASTWEHENKLNRQYQLAEAEAVQMNDRMAELRIIERELERLHNWHSTLADRIANIDIGQEHSDVRARVISEPKASDGPVSPRLTLVGMMCLVGGMGFGMALVYVTDVLDDRFRSPEEMQEQLGAPVLAMIRELPDTGMDGANALQVHVAPESVESEAFRTMRTTLAFSGQDIERIAVTSAEPSDGKTTVLANLATTYAQAGKKTLLVDADLRRPGLTKMFEMRGTGGLSEILRGDDDIATMCAERVRASGVECLDVLACGPRPANPAELLSSTRLADVLGWAESKYDQVLIDCPPILAASDAAIVGQLTEGLILGVQPDKNHRRLVLRAVSGLAAVGVNILGIVANKIDSEKNKGYGYGGYGYGYSYGYGGYGYGWGYGYGYGQDREGSDEDETEMVAGVIDGNPTANRITPRRVA